MLTGEALPSYAALAANLLYTTAGVSVGADQLESKNDDGLFHSDAKNDYYQGSTRWRTNPRRGCSRVSYTKFACAF